MARSRRRQIDLRQRSREPTRWCTTGIRSGRSDVKPADSIVTGGGARKEVLVRVRDRDLQGLVRAGGGGGVGSVREVEDCNRVERDVENDERPLDERVDRVGFSCELGPKRRVSDLGKARRSITKLTSRDSMLLVLEVVVDERHEGAKEARAERAAEHFRMKGGRSRFRRQDRVQDHVGQVEHDVAVG